MSDTAALLTVLVTSPRMPAGLMSRDAWTALEHADRVLAADIEDPLPAAIAASGIEVTAMPFDSAAAAARTLVGSAASGSVLWVGSPDADPGLTDALAEELTRLDEPPQIEVLVGSWDLPGARLLDAVAVMDALRSPGGCPWDAEQTHRSLAKYLLEEAHETVEAIETDDAEHIAEELGDVLLQVLFHARIAADEDPGYDIDDVAAGLVEKLIRRHPHVFADGAASTPEEVEQSWEQIKAAEKTDRDEDDLLAGIPASLSPLLIAEKLLTRAHRRGIHLSFGDGTDDKADLGGRLLALVAEARAAGSSADAVLRATLRDLARPPAE
ncbi:nucleoside triphosphate pyrophosphohydrolase [Flexivirga endophytica]|uniref:Nucleoside triphosphate pyrophosphohydrolase n=1 Tax=Flexivirga endophytica TaxID=1849103 RepID=A0A916TK24_9MICO|nr:MazG family protein [Flexivirga endophytica]GGB48122.1 nucleoside triphosphate pyrophosphohydrolase [Flexivirga endophytica]GHB61065.1 nucleoside triphosphate pyrophosphohydrolase [Flexivirga endophytica]